MNSLFVMKKSEKRKKLKREFRQILIGLLFASPVIIGVIVFTYYPAVNSLYLSFTDYDNFNPANFIGLKNYSMLFNLDPYFKKTFINTFVYAAISIPLNLVLGYFLAVAANLKIKGITVYRTLFYLPVIIPAVASGILFGNMFAVGYDGIINHILEQMGFSAQTWFSSAKTTMPTFIFMGVWNIGGGMIIWLACFKNIPQTLYEAAKLDGANALHCLVKITIPMSTPMIFYNLVTGLIGSLQVTSSMFVGGSDGMGVDASLYFVAVKIYNDAFRSGGNLGYACALAWMLFIVIAILTFIVFKTNKWVHNGEE